MKALYYVGDETMEIRDVPPLKCADDRYLIKVKANGICGSDIEGYLGRSGRRTPPLIMGHEVSGIIEQAPEGGRYARGEKVVIFPKPFCGECEYCKKGMVNVCPAGICMGVLTSPGSMVEYIEVEEKYLIPFDSGLSYEIAALTEPLAVAYRAVYKISDQQIAEAHHVMVIGAGTIGMMALLLLKMRKAKNIIVSDTSPYRLNLALRLGADHIVNPLEKDVVEAVRTITENTMCDISFEAVGTAKSARASLDVLRIGATAIWIGNAQKLVEVDMQKIVTTELVIRGNYVYDFESFRESLNLLENGSIKVEALISEVMPLEQGPQAFRMLKENRDGKIVKVILKS